jgi:hypothetical protein
VSSGDYDYDYDNDNDNDPGSHTDIDIFYMRLPWRGKVTLLTIKYSNAKELCFVYDHPQGRSIQAQPP